MMKTLYEWTLGKAVLISGDGDYKMVVDYLIWLDRFKKILSPNVEFASSLYRHRRNLESHYFDYLDKSSLRKKIGYFPKQS